MLILEFNNLTHNMAMIQRVKTQYMRNPDIVYILKMEYVSKINIFGLKMMVKSGLEKIFLKFLHAQGLFQVCPVGCLSLVLLN